MSREDLVSDGLVTVAEAEKYLRVRRSTVYVLMKRRELPYVKFGRVRRIPRKALIEFAGRNLVAGDDDTPGSPPDDGGPKP